MAALFLLDYPNHPATTMMQLKSAKLSECQRFYQTDLGNFPRVNEILNKTKTTEEIQRINFWRSEARRKFLNQNRKCTNCIHYTANPKDCRQGKLRANVNRKNRCESFEILPELDTPAEEINRAALDRGTNIHHWIEEFFKTGVMPTREQCREIEQISFLLKNLGEDWIMCEELVISQEHRYAGRVDLVAKYDNRIIVFDWTSTRKDFVKSEWYANKFLQTAAYAIAIEEIGLHKVDEVAVVVIGETKATLLRQPVEQWAGEWIKRVEQYYAQHHQ